MTSARESLIPKHGGYRSLKSFQVAQLAYDVTIRFCDRYVDKRSRTHDQMVQAARSGVQNIVEGSQASATSKKTELKLTNVARASLEELRMDYEDFLRQRGLSLWPQDDARRKQLVARRCRTADEVAAWIREVRDGRDGQDGLNGQDGPDGPDGQNGPDGRGRLRQSSSLKPTSFRQSNSHVPSNSVTQSTASKPSSSPKPFRSSTPSSSPMPSSSPTPSSSSMSSIPSMPSIPSMKSMTSIPSIAPSYPEIAANAAHTLIGVACALLDRQIATLAREFETEGGFTERLYRVRTARRGSR